MDTKLKSKGKSLNKRIFIIVLCVMMLPFLSIVVYKFVMFGGQYSPDVVGNELNASYNDIKELMKYSNGFTEDLKESAITREIDNLKYNTETVQHMPSKNDAEYREIVKEKLKSMVNGLIGNIKRNVNIEFYYETDDPNMPMTNVEKSSKEQFEKETLNNYKDYIILKSNKLVYSKSMEAVLGRSMNSFEDHDIYIRLANSLKYGDAIYYEINNYHKYEGIGYVAVALLVVDLIIIFIVFRSIKRNKELKLKNGLLTDVYNKMFFEVRGFFLGIYIIMMICLFSIYIRRFDIRAYKSSDDIPIMMILALMGLWIGYLLILDVLRLIQISREDRLKEEIINKSALIKINRLVKENSLFKSTVGKVGMAVFGSGLYMMLIIATAWSIGRYTLEPYNLVFVFVDIIVTAVIISYIFSIGRNINQIKIATDNIVKGNYNNDIEIKNGHVLKGIANNLINIESGLEAAVKKAVKSEKMKGELITNVSHDLRNPLTSIINYVDLLGKENVPYEDREKYIEVLKEKSQRLKALIEDLFEASKAASGAMEINMENIDPVALLRQTIGEFEDKIEASGLQFIKKVPEEKVIAYADGGKTFRVFQNLISNILKYSMDNSRVYIEVKEEEEFIDVTFRNISKYELNFSEEEILERFKRGDSSRKTEGSGLGLAIAKSLMEIQGGNFKIEIDGDLFKVIVKLRTEN